ncbi:hypothetical protein T11_7836 [Trichinella zimbabwensis]|uniref:Uncharacterized protein n=1 Tax=Trichinella zimbabwensis TaxID=268475 RepID=A0A0V1G7M6_9BILA|nr:hypothetical protein T11_7836 [Trichinella zimbabwensis]
MQEHLKEQESKAATLKRKQHACISVRETFSTF